MSHYLDNFLERNQLDSSYLDHERKWFLDALEAIIEHHNSAGEPIVIGINGCQGSGKSTLADFFATILEGEHQLTTAVLSLDDFYHSSQKRLEIADTTHPLFATRGVPGTHDIPLAVNTIQSLLSSHEKVALPRFEKKRDNPFPTHQWPTVQAPIDIVLLEGWCLGVPPQEDSKLITPINELEAVDDAEGVWRQHVNTVIQTELSDLHDLIDIWVMLKAPSFDVVYQWRLEQEQKLIASLAGQTAQTKVMSPEQIKRFISYFQRLTEQCLVSLPKQCHFVYELDENRNIQHQRQPVKLE